MERNQVDWAVKKTSDGKWKASVFQTEPEPFRLEREFESKDKAYAWAIEFTEEH